MGKKLFLHTYEEIVSMENLLEAWQEFVVGKTSRQDVQEFGSDLMANLFALHGRLASMTYQHDLYEAFTISDPKTRNYVARLDFFSSLRGGTTRQPSINRRHRPKFAALRSQ